MQIILEFAYGLRINNAMGDAYLLSGSIPILYNGNYFKDLNNPITALKESKQSLIIPFLIEDLFLFSFIDIYCYIQVQ